MDAGLYLRSCRNRAGMTIDDVAICVDTVPPVAASRRAEWLHAIEAGHLPMALSTAVALARIPELEFDLIALGAIDAGPMAIRFVPASPLADDAEGQV